MTSPAQPKIAIVEVERLRVAMWPFIHSIIFADIKDLGFYSHFSIILASALS